MVVSRRRTAAGVGLALCGLLMTGCRAEGTIDVLSEEQVAIDLVLSGPDVECSDGPYGLTLSASAVTDDLGLPACHFSGETQATALDQFAINISTAAEYLMVETNLSLGFSDLPASDIQLRFPGQVVSSTTGTVSGNAVYIKDLVPLTQGSGLRVIAFSRPGPPAWMMAAAIGTGSGVVVTLLGLGLVGFARRRRPPGPGLIALETAELPGITEEPSAATGSSRAAAASSRPPPRADPPEDAWLAAPPPEPVGTLDSPETASSFEPAVADGLPAAPAPVDPPDHAAWAPPEDRA